MSHLSDIAATMVPGTWALLCEQGDGSNYGAPIWPPAPSTVGVAIYGYGYACGYDRQADRQRVLFLGGAHIGGVANKADTSLIAYDIPTNRWINLRSALPAAIPDTGGNHHPYGLMCCSSADRKFLWSESNTCVINAFDVNVADLTTRTASDWVTYPSPATYNGRNGRGFIVEFPDRDSLLMYVPDAGVLLEKKHSQVGWKTIFTPSPAYLPEGGAAIYNPVRKEVMFGGGGDGSPANIHFFRFWIYRADGSTAPTPTANLAGMPDAVVGPPYARTDLFAKFWVDSISGEYLFLSTNPDYSGFMFYKYSAVTNAWTRLTTLEASIPIDVGYDGIHTHALDNLVIATLDDMGVTMFISTKVYIYKHTANSDASGLSYARKIARQPGLVAAYGFDSVSNVRKYPTAPYPMTYYNGTSPFVGSCVPLFGSGASYNSDVRGPGEGNARAAEFATVCHYPFIDTTIYNILGGGTGALRITIPSQSSEGTGGFFDTPYQGTDITPKVNLSPSNFGRVWYQVMVRSHNVTNANLYPSMALASGAGPKIIIGAAPPPWLVGSSHNSSHDLYNDIKKNTLFAGYTYAQSPGQTFSQEYNYNRNIGPNTVLQNLTSCFYTGAGAASYTSPPCTLHAPDAWQQLTSHYELRPAATDFVISGNNLTKAGFFTGTDDGWIYRWVYIQDNDGTGLGAYFRIHSKTSVNTVVLTNSNSVDSTTQLPNVIAGTPPAGTRAVVISDYPNSIFEMWVDGVKIFGLTDQPIKWEGADISVATPAGFGAIRLGQHMTQKDSSVVHAEAYYWFDDLIISTEPIPMSQSTAVSTPPDTPSAPVLPWMLRA